jgi:F0F1-type ATP synthase alpha subunit
MQIKADEISAIIKEKIKGFDKQVDVKETGSVIQVGDGIAKVYGLDGAMAGEMLEFPGGLYGIALNLEEDNVGAVLMGDDVGIKEGDPVKRKSPSVKPSSAEWSTRSASRSTAKARSSHSIHHGSRSWRRV